MVEYHKKFISLDLETTNLDAGAGRIIEVGAQEAEIFFDAQSRRVEVKFGPVLDTLVNPEAAVPREVLDLTGITQAELDAAPLWPDIKSKVKTFLGKEVLLGHNLIFDFGFLAAQGLRLKNLTQDTLELAQTILPLHLSHSLESLAGELGVAEGTAHRALADARTCVRVLAAILNEFLGYPPELQKKIKGFLQNSAVVFRELILELPAGRETRAKPAPSVSASGSHSLASAPHSFGWPDKTIVCLPPDLEYQDKWLTGLLQEEVAGLVGVAHPAFLDFLPAARKIANPQTTLCEKRLAAKAARVLPDAPPEFAKIFIKIAIFQSFFPQNLDISAIKWTALERLFLPGFTVEPEICRRHRCQYAKGLSLADQSVFFADLPTLFRLTRDWEADFVSRRLVLMDLAAIEDRFASFVTETWNLRLLRQALEAVFPIGSPAALAEAEEAGNELDLFFGILHLVHLRREGEYSQVLILDRAARADEQWQKLFHPAEKLLRTLEKFLTFLAEREALAGEEELEWKNLRLRFRAFADFVKKFFLDDGSPADQTLWLRFDDRAVDLSASPRLDVSWREFQKKFQSVSIVDQAMPQISREYFERRLGLEKWRVIPAAASAEAAAAVQVKIFERAVSSAEKNIFLKSLSGTTIVVVPNEAQLRESVNGFGSPEGFLTLAYKMSGNLPALRKKIEAALKEPRGNLILFLTNHALRQFPVLPPAKNLVLFRLPFEAPQTRAAQMTDSRQNNFRDSVLPRAVHLLHRLLLKFLSSAAPEPAIYLCDHRAVADYGGVFMDYFQGMPGMDISTIDPV